MPKHSTMRSCSCQSQTRFWFLRACARHSRAMTAASLGKTPQAAQNVSRRSSISGARGHCLDLAAQSLARLHRPGEWTIDVAHLGVKLAMKLRLRTLASRQREAQMAVAWSGAIPVLALWLNNCCAERVWFWVASALR